MFVTESVERAVRRAEVEGDSGAVRCSGRVVVGWGWLWLGLDVRR